MIAIYVEEFSLQTSALLITFLGQGLLLSVQSISTSADMEKSRKSRFHSQRRGVSFSMEKAQMTALALVAAGRMGHVTRPTWDEWVDVKGTVRWVDGPGYGHGG